MQEVSRNVCVSISPYALQKAKNKKIPLKSLISEGFWSEWRDLNPRHPAPKAGALPTALHPDIQFLSLYHGGGENQRFFCLWSFMWSKPLLCRFRQSGKVPQTQVTRLCGVSPCPVPDTTAALPKQAHCTRRRIPPRQLRCTWAGAFLLYHNAGKMQVGMARKMRALGNL